MSRFAKSGSDDDVSEDLHEPLPDDEDIIVVDSLESSDDEDDAKYHRFLQSTADDDDEDDDGDDVDDRWSRGVASKLDDQGSDLSEGSEDATEGAEPLHAIWTDYSPSAALIDVVTSTADVKQIESAIIGKKVFWLCDSSRWLCD